jgi:hypothetical protein
MGNNAIFGVLGLMFLFYVINSTINERDKQGADVTYGYVKYTHARDISRNGINLALKVFADSIPVGSAPVGADTLTFVGDTVINGDYDGGHCVVNAYINGNIAYVRSRAKYEDSVYLVKTKMDRVPGDFPSIGSAMMIHVDSVDFSINNKKNQNPYNAIDGRNWDSSGTVLVGSGDVAGVTVLTPHDSSTVAAFGQQILGTQDVAVNDSMTDPAYYADLYKSLADLSITPTNPISGNLVLGNALNPKVVYISGGPDSLHPLKISGTVEGWGVLVIEGSVEFAGNFTWHGLMIISGTSDVNFSVSSGTPLFIGSVMITGPPHSSVAIKGNPQFKYSADALADAQFINKLQTWRILEWYE